MSVFCSDCGEELSYSRNHDADSISVDPCVDCIESYGDNNNDSDYECTTFEGFSVLVEKMRSDALVCECEVDDLKEEIVELEDDLNNQIKILEDTLRGYTDK